MKGTTSIVAAGAAAAAVAGVAVASGGPPPASPQPDPPAYTVVATGSAQRHVVAPKRRSNRTIERAVQASRRRALPPALAAARLDAGAVGSAAGLRPGRVVGLRRDVAPPGPYWDEEAGTFSPGRWCGRVFSGRRIVRRPDGSTRRVSRYRYGCRVPKLATARVTVTFAAQTG